MDGVAFFNIVGFFKALFNLVEKEEVALMVERDFVDVDLIMFKILLTISTCDQRI